MEAKGECRVREGVGDGGEDWGNGREGVGDGWEE